ncbi:hypothetical protein SUGI_0945310 [Cryptomeria japonica]|nr:hypothetical protein SUGI_0945310 [Cryptomeria japonica]
MHGVFLQFRRKMMKLDDRGRKIRERGENKNIQYRSGVAELEKDSMRTLNEEFCSLNEEDEEIDKKADIFIRNFYHQLRLQRLGSFRQYEEMLARGVD